MGSQARGQISATWTNLHPASTWYSYANGASPAQQAGQIYVGTKYHAALWSGSVASLVDLNPAGAATSWAYAVNGGQQVGVADWNGKSCAALWSGAAASFVSLNPDWATSGEALGVCAGQQVGWLGNTNGFAHAVLWSGTSNSCIDLHPPFEKNSRALATSGSNQVGYIQHYTSGNIYAAMWSGSAASFVELGPEWAFSTTVIWSEALAIGGTNQAGFFQLYNENVKKAALWSGAPQSFRSLHPDVATASEVWATTDSMQVGFATVGGQTCLALWRGTPESFVNLGPVAAGFGTGCSNFTVRGIWIEGNTIYLAGDADSQAISCRIQLLPPSLNLAGVPSQGGIKVLMLVWTNNGVRCVLESSGTLGSSWGAALGIQTTNENRVSTTITNTGHAQFFRLRGNSM